MAKSSFFSLFLIGTLTLIFAGCSEEEPVNDFVARVGHHYLTRSELQAALGSIPEGIDSTEASKQVIEQWVANTLLYQEAQRRGLRNEPEVRRLLEESEQSVMASALLTRLYDEDPPSLSRSDLAAYFERHKEQLRLREPFVHVRHLSNPSEDSLRVAQQLLRQTRATGADSMWQIVLTRFASDQSGSTALSDTYYPESRLFAEIPPLQEAVPRLQAGQFSEVIAHGDVFHFVQLVDRIPAGELPRLEWMQEELQRRMAIQERKQMYAREVQRLRNEALAREELDVPD